MYLFIVDIDINESIVNIAAIGSGTDTNDLFSFKMPVPKRSQTVRYPSKNRNENEKGKENEKGNEKEKETEKET